jgi:hypothetical protein
VLPEPRIVVESGCIISLLYMERFQLSDTPRDTSKRKERVAHFVNYIIHHADPELCYFCLALNYDEMDQTEKSRLVNVIANAKTNHASEFALRLLCDQPKLDAGARDALLRQIVQQADKTTCSLALTLVPNLGSWESKLSAAFSH